MKMKFHSQIYKVIKGSLYDTLRHFNANFSVPMYF